ncbi:CAP domain-containing protein [Paucibacter soli]|uniref:CAP domain-containing protein n=1 Tax=Paucibacter soli TaxID=3133433 RepID=UPI0030B43662
MSGRWGWCLAFWALGAAAQGEVPACPVGLTPAAVLQRLNALRAEPQPCAGAGRPAAPALRWDLRLAGAAEAYAGELAQRDAISHVGRQGRSLRERLGAAGYLAQAAGENLVAGPESLDEALQHWLASPAHCRNLMAPDLFDAGLACVAAPGKYQRFWVLLLGRTRPE